MQNSREYIKKEIKMEDLELRHQEIAAIIGLDKYLELCWAFAGAGIYLPSEKWFVSQIAKRKIIENKPLVESKALTINQLAKMYGVSQSAAYNYLRGDK